MQGGRKEGRGVETFYRLRAVSLLFCKKPEVFGSQIAIVGPRKKEEF